MSMARKLPEIDADLVRRLAQRQVLPGPQPGERGYWSGQWPRALADYS